MLGWAIVLLVVAVMAGAVGLSVAGAAFAAKILFVLALLAFLISAVIEVNRRGLPRSESGPGED